MATVIDELLINLGFDADPTGAHRFDASLNNVLGTIGKVGSVMTAVTSVAAGFLGKAIIDTASQFEKFETQLTTIEGSSEKAKKSLDWISEFAEKTPYDIAGVTDAFVKLKAYGLDPANDGLLTSLGNTASAMGKSLDQSIEMMADAVRGESERLKEFGIVGSKNKNEMTYSYTLNGESLTKTVENDAVAIQAALQEIFDEKFAGGMDAMSKTWDGQIAKMGDTWTGFKRRIGERGIFDRLKSGLGEVSGFLEKNSAAIDAFADRIGDSLVAAFDWLEDTLWDVWDSALWVRDAFVELDKKFGLASKGGKFLAGIIALITANLIGLMALKVLAFITALWRGFVLLFSPLAAIGLTLLGVMLIIEDIYGYLNGKESLFAQFAKDYPLLGGFLKLFIHNLEVVAAVIGVIIAGFVAMKAVAVAGFIASMIAAGVAYASIAMGAIASAIAVAAAWAVAFWPFALLAVVIAGVIAGFWFLYENWTDIWQGIKDVAKSAADFIMDMFGPIIDGILWALEKITGRKLSVEQPDKVTWDVDDDLEKKLNMEKSGNIDYSVNAKKVLPLNASQKDGLDKFMNVAIDYSVKAIDYSQKAVDKTPDSSSAIGKTAIDYRKPYVNNNTSQNQSTVTQTINVNSANEAAIIANRTAQGARQQSNGYQ